MDIKLPQDKISHPWLVIILCRQGRLSKRLGSALSKIGVLITSRDRPVGDYSKVAIAVYYESIEALNKLVLGMRIDKNVSRRFLLSQLDQECLIRLQRQLFLHYFTEEWTFSRMAQCAYPKAWCWDTTVANSRFRGHRLRKLARRRAVFSAVGIARRIISQWVIRRKANLTAERPRIIWGGVSAVEMEDDPTKLSLPQYLREVAGHLGIEEEKIWIMGHSPKECMNAGIGFSAGCRILFEAIAAVWLVTVFVNRHLLRNLAIAESATYAWARHLLSIWKPVCVVGTISEIAYDSPFVVAARVCGIPSCLVSYASLNIACAEGRVWDDLEPGFRYSLYSYYLVWGESVAQLFRRYACIGSKVLVSGPMMFASSVRNNGHRPTKELFRLGIFDISPHSEKLLASIGVGRGWYTLADVRKFYDDIIEVLEKLSIKNVEVVIKPKRDPRSPQVASGYAEFLESLSQSASGRVTIRSPLENPWAALSAVDAVISMPFTSTTSAGAVVGLPAIFYSPCASVEPGRYTMDGDKLIRGKNNLSAWLSRVYSEQHRVVRIDYSGSRQLAQALAWVTSLQREGFPT